VTSLNGEGGVHGGSIPRPRRAKALALLVCLVAVAYGTSLANDLVFDDLIFATRDPRVQSLEAAPRLFVEPLWGFRDRPGRESVHQYYRPLQTLPLALSRSLFGAATWPMHLLSVVLHLANCLLVLGLLRRLLDDENAAIAATALFAVHPGYSEAVFWASDVSGLGASLCLLAIVRLHAEGATLRPVGAVAASSLFLTGLWCKESGVLAPALMASYDLLVAPERGFARLMRTRRAYLALVPALILYLSLRVHALGGLLPGVGDLSMSGTEFLANAVALLPDYARTFFWPFQLNMYHDFHAVAHVADPRLWMGAAMMLVGLVLFVRSARRVPRVAFGLAWAAITVSPHLLVRWPQLNVYAERYLYLPAFGIALVAANAWIRAGIGRTAKGRRLSGLAIAVVLVVFVTVDINRAGDWRDEVALYTKTLTQSSRAELVRNNLALQYLQLGQYDKGIAEIHELIRINPEFTDAYHNLGLLEMAAGRDADALAAFRSALTHDPNKPESLLDAGYLEDKAGNRAAAVALYRRLVHVDPANVAGWYNLAVIAVEAGQTGNARQALERVLRLAPDDRAATELRRRLEAHVAAPRTSQELRRRTIARCRAAKRALDAGKVRDALYDLQAAAWLDESAALPHHYLANVYVLIGRLDDALAEQRRALELAPGNPLYQRNLASLEAAVAARSERESQGDRR